MTFHSEVWRLPGPGGFVRDVARAAAGGRNVLAIVPRYISEDEEYSDALAAAVLGELDDQHRLYPSASEGSLVSALGFTMTSGFDDAPSTVPTLLTHPDVVGRIFVCNAADLSPVHRSELPQFLERLNEEARPLSTHARGTIIFVVGRDAFERDHDSPAMAPIWYWDRVARWDTAALVAGRLGANLPAGVEGEVRLETIIEVARWNFAQALELASEWSSPEFDVSVWARNKAIAAGAGLAAPRRTTQKQPPESYLDSWDEGLVESWHGVPEVAPTADFERTGGIERLIWRAQARVLMPWLEVRRVRIEHTLRQSLGARRMENAVREFSYQFPGVGLDPTAPAELATLARIVSARLGRSDDRLRETTRLLVSARNQLSHLTRLTDENLTSLVRASAWLG